MNAAPAFVNETDRLRCKAARLRSNHDLGPKRLPRSPACAKSQSTGVDGCGRVLTGRAQSTGRNSPVVCLQVLKALYKAASGPFARAT